MNCGKQILEAELQRLNDQHECLLKKLSKYHPEIEETKLQVNLIRVQMKDVEACIRMVSELDCLKEPSRTSNDETIAGKL